MRFLIVAAAVLACAAAAPSGALWAGSYAGGLIGQGVAYSAPVAVAAPAIAAALPTISSGDIQGAAIDAKVVASDHTRAVVDQAKELQGQAINAAESNSWQAVDAAKTAEAAWDGAAAGAAPVLAKQLAGRVAPVAAAWSAPAVVAAPAAWSAPAPVAWSAPTVAAAPVAWSAPAVAAAPVAWSAPAVAAAPAAWSAPAVVAAPAAWSAPAVVAGSTSVSTQSLSQTHPAPVVHAPVAYAAKGVHAW